MAQRIHTKELLNEYLRIFDVELKTALNLRSVNKGSFEWMPAETLTNLVNGIWVSADPTIQIDRVELPRALNITYSFRVVYIKRIDINTNVNEQKINDINVIVEEMLDQYSLTDLTLTNGQVIWSYPTIIEIDPPEDDFVLTVASDLVAAAFRIDTQVRTRLI